MFCNIEITAFSSCIGILNNTYTIIFFYNFILSVCLLRLTSEWAGPILFHYYIIYKNIYSHTKTNTNIIINYLSNFLYFSKPQKSQ